MPEIFDPTRLFNTRASDIIGQVTPDAINKMRQNALLTQDMERQAEDYQRQLNYLKFMEQQKRQEAATEEQRQNALLQAARRNPAMAGGVMPQTYGEAYGGMQVAEMQRAAEAAQDTQYQQQAKLMEAEFKNIESQMSKIAADGGDVSPYYRYFQKRSSDMASRYPNNPYLAGLADSMKELADSNLKIVPKKTTTKREPTTAPFTITSANIDQLLERAEPGTLPYESLKAMREDFKSRPKGAKPVNAIVEEEYDPDTNKSRIKKITEQAVPGVPTVKVSVGGAAGKPVLKGTATEGNLSGRPVYTDGTQAWQIQNNQRVPYEGGISTIGMGMGFQLTEDSGGVTPAERSANFSWARSPKAQTLIRRTNSVFDAIEEAKRLSKNVPDYGNKPLNAVSQNIQKAFGDVDIAIAQLGETAVADEFNQIMGGSGGAVRYFDDLKQKFSTAQTLGQKLAIYDQAAKFIAQRQLANVEGTPYEGKYRKVFEKYGVGKTPPKTNTAVEARKNPNYASAVAYAKRFKKGDEDVMIDIKKKWGVEAGNAILTEAWGAK